MPPPRPAPAKPATPKKAPTPMPLNIVPLGAQ
jgi:hypothetical protein